MPSSATAVVTRLALDALIVLVVRKLLTTLRGGVTVARNDHRGTPTHLPVRASRTTARTACLATL